VAAYNEEAIIPQKIKNCAEIDYPSHILNAIFITDGSTDYSNDLIRQHDFITLLHLPESSGKLPALKRAMQYVKTPIVVFSDANSMLNPGSINSLVPHFSNEMWEQWQGRRKSVAEWDPEYSILFCLYESLSCKRILEPICGAGKPFFGKDQCAKPSNDNKRSASDFFYISF